MKTLAYAALFLAAYTVPAQTAEVKACGDLNRIEHVVGSIRSFAEGRIKVAHSFSDEPVCCGSNLIIVTQGNMPGAFTCFAVGDKGNEGFSTIALEQAKAKYEPQKGLLLTVPYTRYSDKVLRTFNVRINLEGDSSVKVEQ